MITTLELIEYLKNCGKTINFSRIKPETKFHLEFASNLKMWALEGRLDGIWFHVANEGAFSTNFKPLYGILLKSMGKHNGIFDWVFISSKKGLLLELKCPKKKLSPFQELFQKWCHHMGVTAEKAETLEECEKILRREGFLK